MPNLQKRSHRVAGVALVAVTAMIGATACGSDSSADKSDDVTITVQSHESFALSKEVLDKFTADTGIKVTLAPQGDAGAALSQAILTKDHPVGDVFFGVDNTLLTRAIDAGLFAPYSPDRLSTVPDQYELDGKHELTPIDHGEVCVDYDKAWFAKSGVAVPASLEDLTKSEYRNKLVVENPTASSPGLAFVLATVSHFGEGKWQDYWNALKANGVTISGGWEDAYNTSFSGGAGKGDRPLVVSYASSPPADIVYSTADPKPTDTNIGVITSTCFQQVEFAGVLKATKHAAEARRFIDFLLSKAVQDDIPLNMFVYPVTTDATLPELFTKFAAPVAHPITLPATDIGKNRERWTQEWTQAVNP